MAMLRAGDRVSIEAPDGGRLDASIGAVIGCGGQGCVFELDVEDDRFRNVVVKWYNDLYATHFHAEQLQAIRDLLEEGPPSADYLWPKALVFSPPNNSFGYVMDRRPDGFESLAHVVSKSIGSLSYDALITFSLHVAYSLQQLHTSGLAYRDVNLTNFFIRPASGETLICDTDNIGFEQRTYMGVRGQDDFMAPEIVRGEAPPSANTDRHSLAVLLFQLFMRWPPLEGAATVGLLDDDARLRHFGRSPVFCLDPSDASNRPTADHVERYWWWFPGRFRDLFIRAFTRGLHDPQHGRVMESEWLEALVQLRDSMTVCSTCGGLNFLDTDAPRCRRPGCTASIATPGALEVRLGPGRIRRPGLSAGRTLYGYHLTTGYDHHEVVGKIVLHPDDPSALALVNASSHSWQLRFGDGTAETLAPSEGVRLEAGLVVHADKATITVPHHG